MLNFINYKKMKYDLKTAVISYFFWLIMSYLTASFYVWDFNPGNWQQVHRDYFTMFGPVFGVFIFLSVLFWEEAFKENNHEIE